MKAHRPLVLLLPLLLASIAPAQCTPPFLVDGPLRFEYWFPTSKTRVGRTTFEFEYQVSIRNASQREALAVRASVTSSDPATVIVADTIEFGDIAPGASATSLDRLVIRQNRATPLQPTALDWEIVGRTEAGLRLVDETDDVADAVLDVPPGTGVSPAAIAVDADGAAIARNRLEVFVTRDATFADAEALLASLGAEVEASLAGLPLLLLRFDDVGSLTALDAVVESLESDPRVETVLRVGMPAALALPPGFATAADVSTDLPSIVTHRLLPARNAAAAMTDPPDVLVVDFFGLGPISDPLNTESYSPDQFTSLPLPLLESYLGPDTTPGHGYSVVGPLLGTFVAAQPDVLRNRVTGGLVVPTPSLDVVDAVRANGLLSSAAMRYRAIQLAAQAPGRVVLNWSLGAICDASISCFEAFDAEAAFWAESVRAADLEDDLLVVAAAGNEGVSVEFAGSLQVASLDSVLDDPLRNTLVVGSVSVDPDAPHAPRCPSAFSNLGGDLWAAGELVLTYAGPEAGSTYADGTSIAAPAVAGIAASVWAAAPELPAPALAELLRATARFGFSYEDETGCTPDPDDYEDTGTIDAYSALLAVDLVGGVDADPASVDAPVRAALLDLNEDGAFDETDVALFLDGWSVDPGALDYGDTDLNGDGRSGGASRAPFNLDALEEERLGEPDLDLLTVVFENEGFREFDENAVRDDDILCYYTQTPLYSGSQSALESIEDFRCLPEPDSCLTETLAEASVNDVFIDGPLPMDGQGIPRRDSSGASSATANLSGSAPTASIAATSDVSPNHASVTFSITTTDEDTRVIADLDTRYEARLCGLPPGLEITPSLMFVPGQLALAHAGHHFVLRGSTQVGDGPGNFAGGSIVRRRSIQLGPVESTADGFAAGGATTVSLDPQIVAENGSIRVFTQLRIDIEVESDDPAPRTSAASYSIVVDY